VEVVDTGTWRPPPADRGFRGRGLELISALAQDVEIVHGADTASGSGTRVRFRFAPVEVDDVSPARPPAPAARVYDDEPARLDEEQDAGGVRLTISGELDLATAGPLGAEVLRRMRAAPAGAPIELDLRPTTYLASAGVGAVLEARAQAAAAGLPFSVRTTEGTAPHRILGLAGLTQLLNPGDPVRRDAGHGSAPVAES
jgi:anti-anti-sigma factor